MDTTRLPAKTAMIIAPTVVFAAVALAGCAGDTDDTPPSTAPSHSAQANPPTATPSGGPADTLQSSSSTTRIVLEIDGREIAGQLDDSATAASLAAQLPLTLTFADHGGQEKYAELPEALDLTGAPTSSGAEPLQIGYYAPDQRLILYYTQVGTFPGIVPIGTYADTAALQGQTGQFTATIRAAG